MKNEITQKIGRRMADIRKSKQLTQEQLANLAHVSPSEVSRIESFLYTLNRSRD